MGGKRAAGWPYGLVEATEPGPARGGRGIFLKGWGGGDNFLMTVVSGLRLMVAVGKGDEALPLIR